MQAANRKQAAKALISDSDSVGFLTSGTWSCSLCLNAVNKYWYYEKKYYFDFEIKLKLS